MSATLNNITDVILKAREKAFKETSSEPEPGLTKPLEWPINCTVGPGLEGAIACETKVGYVNGAKGWLIYRGYNIFDLCAYSTYEEVSYLLLHGKLPTQTELQAFKDKLHQHQNIPQTIRLLLGFPIEDMNPMAALKLGTTLMKFEFTDVGSDAMQEGNASVISADEDSIAMETKPMGEKNAIYEFRRTQRERTRSEGPSDDPSGIESCYHLIAGVSTLAAAIARVRKGQLPLEPDSSLSHAGNLIYMMTGRRPTPLEERVMDVALILHADHGMNASTFASMVVASTLSDIYLSVGAGIAALNGPLHGGANEMVIRMLKEIGSVERVKPWLQDAVANKKKIMGFGHRVYKALDPRARVLGPLAKYLTQESPEQGMLFRIAEALENEVMQTVGKEKKIFPNVDYYSGIVYAYLGIPKKMFTPMFAVSRVAGWTARVQEYLQNNRIFRPRAMYTGEFDTQYVPIDKRG